MRLETVMLGVLDGLLPRFELPDMPDLPDLPGPPDLSALVPDLSVPEVPSLPSVDVGFSVDVGGLVPSALDPVLAHPWLTVGAVAVLAVAVAYRERTLPLLGSATRRVGRSARSRPKLTTYAVIALGGFVAGYQLGWGVWSPVVDPVTAVIP
jgi:hypothetical protein